MTTLAVIPARLGASRLPRKPLRLLAGSPLVVRVWEHVAGLALADRCVVATDSDEVAAAVRRAGAEVVLTSPAHPSGTDRVAEVAARREFAGYDAVVNVQGDEPFIDGDAIRGALRLVADGRFPLGTAAARAPAAILADPDVVKVVRADDGRALYFSRAAIPHLRDAGDGSGTAERDSLVAQHVGVYAYTRQALAGWVTLPTHPLERVERLEQLRPLAAGMPMGVALIAGRAGALRAQGGIDTEDDLARANAQWTDLIAGRL
jgi:3-deoxy-manno-octulosonate cytidylyltransferase (CMP-KDO synthetase)